MIIKLVIVPEGAGNNQAYEYKSWDELYAFVESKLGKEPVEEKAVEEEPEDALESPAVAEVFGDAKTGVDSDPTDVPVEGDTTDAPKEGIINKVVNAVTGK